MLTALARFYAAIAGNFTYSMAILLRTTSMHAIMKALPWLAGSVLVMFMDCYIVYQSAIYGAKARV